LSDRAEQLLAEIKKDKARLKSFINIKVNAPTLNNEVLLPMIDQTIAPYRKKTERNIDNNTAQSSSSSSSSSTLHKILSLSSKEFETKSISEMMSWYGEADGGI
jgi:hypothetical protein